MYVQLAKTKQISHRLTYMRHRHDLDIRRLLQELLVQEEAN